MVLAIALTSAVLLAVVIRFTWWWFTEGNNEYWPKRGVRRALMKEFATYTELLTGKKNITDVDLYCYNKYKDEPFVGIMELRRPAILIRDLELLKRIYVKDFDHFVDRRKFHIDNEFNDYFLFGLEGQQWKDLRSVMGPTFTSGKLKRMFEYFERSGEDLVKYVEEQKRKTGLDSVELRGMYGRFVMDLIAATTFGIDGQCLKQEDSAFLKHGQDMVRNDIWRILRGLMFMISPSLMSALRIPFFPAGPASFFKGVIKRVLKERQEKHGNYKDFIQLMMESANKASDTQREKEYENEDEQLAPSDGKYKVTDGNILANGLVFIIAGFEGTETVLTLSTYYCAIYPEMQTRLRDEIESVLEENGGKSSYDAIAKMEYLNMFVTEVLRLHPPFTRTERRVTKEYPIPGTKVVLPVGTIVVIPILGIQHDEKNFPEPEKFNPERFSPENKAKLHPYAWMPFGHGPRNCIGDRYALIEAKAGLVQIIRNFEILPCAETFVPLRFETGPNVIKADKNLRVSFKPRN
jgi:cytochrome P450 family 9